MVYKLSNAADKSKIEEKFNTSFKYPNLHQPRLVIDGLLESSVAVCTTENPELIDFAIWGLMPNKYKEDWATFQSACNTLNFNLTSVKSTKWLNKLLGAQRSLVLVTGYFCYFLRNGKIYPYYVCLENEEPFGLAGIYSKLDDGFLSTGILTTKAERFISRFHNIDKVQPLIIPESVASTWLDKNTTMDIIEGIINRPPRPKLKTNPIASEFFKNNILYDSILQPVHYDDIPSGS